MSRKLVLLALLAVSLSPSAFARTRSVSHPEIRGNAGTVSGLVSSVQGNLIRLADGLITVDATDAKVIDGRGREGAVADIEPGMLVLAVLRDADPAPNAPLRASLVTAISVADVTLTGAVESVDTLNRTLTVLGRTIHVNDDTSFGGFRLGEGTGLGSIQRNQVVQVQADAVNGRLVAREVLVLTPVPPRIDRLRGTVITIGTDAWTVEKEEKGRVTLVVNAQTKIVGSPKVGDTVEVLYNVDSANRFIAISIVRFERTPVPKIVRVHGFVKAIEGGTWTVRTDDGEKKFTVNERTKVTPGIVVGDRVDVLALENEDGTLTALAVVKLRF